MTLNSVAERLLEYLKAREGAKNAVYSAELERVFMMSGPAVRDLIRELRRQGHPIGNGPTGYYYCVTTHELDALVADLEGRAKSMFNTISQLKKNYDNPRYQQATLF